MLNIMFNFFIMLNMFTACLNASEAGPATTQKNIKHTYVWKITKKSDANFTEYFMEKSMRRAIHQTVIENTAEKYAATRQLTHGKEIFSSHGFEGDNTSQANKNRFEELEKQFNNKRATILAIAQAINSNTAKKSKVNHLQCIIQ